VIALVQERPPLGHDATPWLERPLDVEAPSPLSNLGHGSGMRNVVLHDEHRGAASAHGGSIERNLRRRERVADIDAHLGSGIDRNELGRIAKIDLEPDRTGVGVGMRRSPRYCSFEILLCRVYTNSYSCI
jgi:hypothetical protein